MTWVVGLAGASSAGWSGAVRLSARVAASKYPQVAFDRRGDAVAAWDQERGSSASYEVMVSQRRIAVDARGDALVTWIGNAVKAALRRHRSGKWGAAVKLGGGMFSEPALDPSGRGLVAWERFAKHPTAILIEAAAWR